MGKEGLAYLSLTLYDDTCVLQLIYRYLEVTSTSKSGVRIEG